jgi:hypothetical protein
MAVNESYRRHVVENGRVARPARWRPRNLAAMMTRRVDLAADSWPPTLDDVTGQVINSACLTQSPTEQIAPCDGGSQGQVLHDHPDRDLHQSGRRELISPTELR